MELGYPATNAVGLSGTRASVFRNQALLIGVVTR